MSHHEPPSSAAVLHPPRTMLHRVRPGARRLLGRRYVIGLHGLALVPPTGPVIFAANHIGLLDGPLLAAFAPRAVHTLTKQEIFRGRPGRILHRSGQIPLDRFAPDPRAVRTALRVLRDGGAVGVFPEGARGDGELRRFHHGAAYLALVSGATVAPVIVLGSREPGAGINSTPVRGSRIDLTFGRPVRITARPWPRSRGMVSEASMLLRERLLETLDEARARTGRDLPGPLPAGQTEDDPATGLVDEEPR